MIITNIKFIFYYFHKFRFVLQQFARRRQLSYMYECGMSITIYNFFSIDFKGTLSERLRIFIIYRINSNRCLMFPLLKKAKRRKKKTKSICLKNVLSSANLWLSFDINKKIVDIESAKDFFFSFSFIHFSVKL